MARTATKRKVQLTQPVPSTTSAHATPPAPFTLADAALKPLLEILDKSKVYIVHIDTHPWQFKRRIFAVPVLLNLGIAALIAWRWTVAIPAYTTLLWRLVGKGGTTAGTTVDQARSWFEWAWFIIKRILVAALDWLLVSYIAPWPVTFFLERPANPVSWRWHVGFENKEIVVRVSRGWGTTDLGNATRKGADNPFFKTRIAPAVEESYLREKTGYVMMGKDFDLDFKTMIEATAMVEGEKLAADDLKATVLAFSDSFGWMVWKVRGGGNEAEEEEAREKIVAFKVRQTICKSAIQRLTEWKDRLTAMGKENLFFRWLELLQYESSRAEISAEERRAAILSSARGEFTNQDVDFDDFLEKIGGVAALPGLGQV